MKRNWMQVLSLLLSVVLLAVIFKQNQMLESLRNSVQNVENRMHDLEYDVQGISGDVTRAIEDAEKLISDYEVQPLYVDPETQTLEANVVVTLKRWSEDTAVQMKAVVGRDTFITHLPINGNGVCTGQMAFPVNQGYEVWLEASVIQNGTTTREELGGWSDISMLLPLQMHSWGGSVPTYENGKLVIDQYEGDLEDPDGQVVTGIDSRYRLYVNGQLVKEEAQCRDWEYDCETGDEIRLTLFCRDEYGLGYEFTLDEFVCDEDAGEHGTGVVTTGGTASPILSWN